MRKPPIASLAALLLVTSSFLSSSAEDAKSHGEQAEKDHQAGLDAAGRGEWKEASEYFAKCLKADTGWKRAWLNLGVAREHLADLKGALAAYDKVVELDPKDAEGWEARSRTHESLGHFDEAIDDASKAIDLDPAMTRAWINRGVARQGKRDHAGAIADFTKALELDPKDSLAWYNRGVVRRDSGDCENAVLDFSKAIELRPDHGYAILNRGGALMALSRIDEGMADLDKALQFLPDHVFARRWRSVGLRIKGDLKSASAELAKVLKIEPKDDWAFHQLALVEFLSGRNDASIEASTKSLDLWNKDIQPCPATFRWLVRVRSGKKELARKELEEAVGASASANAASFELVIAAFCLDRMSAQDLIEMAGNADASKRGWYVCQARFWKGFVAENNGKHQEAIEDFEAAIKAGKPVDETYGLAEFELRRLRKRD